MKILQHKKHFRFFPISVSKYFPEDCLIGHRVVLLVFGSWYEAHWVCSGGADTDVNAFGSARGVESEQLGSGSGHLGSDQRRVWLCWGPTSWAVIQLLLLVSSSNSMFTFYDWGCGTDVSKPSPSLYFVTFLQLTPKQLTTLQTDCKMKKRKKESKKNIITAGIFFLALKSIQRGLMYACWQKPEVGKFPLCEMTFSELPECLESNRIY